MKRSDIETIEMKDFWIQNMKYNEPYIYMVNNWIPSGNANYQICIYDINSKKYYHSNARN